jgi:DNA recombination protein RmuC
MDTPMILVLTLFPALAIGGVVGATIAYLYCKARVATLEAEHAADLEKIDWIRDSQENLRETFDALAAKALHKNASDFSGRIHQQLGSHVTQIGTLKTSLEANINKIDHNIRDLERKREAAYQGLTHNVENLQKAYAELRDATSQLLNALKSGPVRGRWGEIQLRKIVELAGMNEHVSFFEQVGGTDGKPDMLVHLPNQGQITVDSKFPLQAFLEGMASTDPALRHGKMVEHTRTLRQTIKDLAKKGYWEQFQPSPELVIMFIPVESCLMAAYECDPEIIEFALSQKVILASPITLLGFMKAIAYGWQQFVISKNAKVILEHGKELHRRAATWLEHFRKTGDKIGGVIEAYNASVSSLQTRFFPAARRFEELTSMADELAELTTVNKGLNLAPSTEEIAPEKTPIEAVRLLNLQPARADIAPEKTPTEAVPLLDGPPASETPTWFITRDGTSKDGPFTGEKLAEWLDSGILERTAMALAEGETTWVPIGVIQERYRPSGQPRPDQG